MKIKKKEKKYLQLYVWTDFSPDYTGGLAVSLATTETDARAQIIGVYGLNPDHWGNLTVYSCTHKMAVCVSGGG